MRYGKLTNHPLFWLVGPYGLLPVTCCPLLVEFRLVNIVVKVMGDVFPELKQREAHIREIIAAEEASFGKTLLKVSLIIINSTTP